MLGLSQLEQAYYGGNKRRLVIRKTISLMQLNPLALLNLRNNGTCSFEFSEMLFDYDFPGHYCRKIQSVAVTLPAVTGPYQSINGILTQTGNTVLVTANADCVDFLLGGESTGQEGIDLRINWRSGQQIALSTGLGDTGVLDMGGADDRYLPFEGTGGHFLLGPVSADGDQPFRFFDHQRCHHRLTYSALSGGSVFQDAVVDLLRPLPYVNYRLFSLAQDFSAAWFAFVTPPMGATSQSMTFAVPAGLFPANLSGLTLIGLQFQLFVAEGLAFTGTLAASLSVPGVAQSIALGFTQSVGSNTIATPPITVANDSGFVTGNWLLTVNKTDIPACLQGADGMLDPTKLLGIGAIVTYQANVIWG